MSCTELAAHIGWDIKGQFKKVQLISLYSPDLCHDIKPFSALHQHRDIATIIAEFSGDILLVILSRIFNGPQ